jgi:Asp-tRNA(Asn)/Glu-tRNA(Gln) amidotransferase A subunit family amidase
MAKSVWDLALLMDVMKGNDPEDPSSKPEEARAFWIACTDSQNHSSSIN